jgi:hypothetical protein
MPLISIESTLPSSDRDVVVSLPLDRVLRLLRTLPAEQETTLALLQELNDCPQPPLASVQLRGELAEQRQSRCEAAHRQGQWLTALEHHDALLPVVIQLAEQVPQQASVFWARYGNLLAFFTASVHGAVVAGTAEEPELAMKAELCWEISQRLQSARQLPAPLPDWLEVLEQQLVQQGAAFWRELLEDDQMAEPQVARRRAIRLLQRLEGLIKPSPEANWMGVHRRQLLEQQVTATLQGDTLDAGSVADLIDDLESVGSDCDRQEDIHTALLRARLALQLLAPAAVSAAEAPVPMGPDETNRQDPSNTSFEAESPRESELARMVLEPATHEPSLLEFDLGPIVRMEPADADQALEEFIWNLPRGVRALAAGPALLGALSRFWEEGKRLNADELEHLAVLAASWQRRMADRQEPLHELDWQQGLLVELDGTELAALLPLLATPEQMEPALAELRRNHHNADFWKTSQEQRWMVAPEPLEALRRLHAEQGFYASSIDPMRSLRIWGEEATRALLDAELWTDDAGSLRLWLGLAQEMVGLGLGPLPMLGAPPSTGQLLTALGGQEVIYVGDNSDGVRQAHGKGLCFRGQPFGLRVIETPSSRWPARPAGGYEESLSKLLNDVDALYRDRPFDVLLADCGIYRLALMRAVHQRYGSAAISSASPMADWLSGS